jgi:UDP-N-acetylglucosamine 2-epimerase (non-hydrolysing)
MIAVVYGTTGELIKLAPLLRRLEARDIRLLRLCTGQQVDQIPTMLTDFGLGDVDVWLGRGHGNGDLERPRQIPRWLAGVAARSLAGRRDLVRRLHDDTVPPLLIVHGDTMTTLLGAALGRVLRVPVAHVEAGMRSGDWRRPFPEELNRRLTAKLATIHFAPGPRAVGNLLAESAPGEVVDTAFNTVADNIREAPATIPPGIAPPQEPFGIVSLHRQELLYDRGALSGIMKLLRTSAEQQAPLLFIDHPISGAAVDAAGLGGLFDSERFVRVPRQRYFSFLSLLKRSEFLVTDSGGSQEECAFLGHPCLIHRTVTEHETGLGGPVVLSLMDLAVVRDFLSNPGRHRTEPPHLEVSPSERIVAHLEERGFVRPAAGALRRTAA